MELADGDFIELAWYPSRPTRADAPIVLLFHGLEGSAHSPYAIGMLRALADRGWSSAVVHFRGCSGKPNRLWRGYHSGEYHDAAQAIEHCRESYPQAPMAAIGYSLGGNMLANYLAHHPKTSLRAACIVSAPLHLAACSARINHGFSKVYQGYLLKRMKANLRTKLTLFHDAPLTDQQIANWQTFTQFDDGYTAPAHGFKDAAHYYQQCSALPMLTQIQTPTWILHANDDPFMDEQVIPTSNQLSPHVEYRLLNKGGHVGFVEGSLRRPRFWLESSIPSWIANKLETHT
jgi:predicted alpha/beta-fold hydrolase